ncbi:calcium/sodium antiporter [Candidatus Peribacteria bacterium]|nr:calcium/sodium antiporter [Candidatus Peribacteria bacterium]
MFIATTFLLLGLGLLVKGADWLVDGASSLAKRIGVSDLSIGLTVVAFGTSMPELVVNVVSSYSGATDIAIGNIVGSNTANILLILGVSSVITNISVQTSTVWKEIPFALLASVVLYFMANDILFDAANVSELTQSEGFVLIAFFLIFLWYIAGMRRNDPVAADDDIRVRNVWPSCGFVLAGLTLLIGGGKLTVDGAVTIAQALGVSQSLIGLTIVAVGTSLPEFATSVVAARKGRADIAVGNIVGSNIFNIFWILGVSALIAPLPFRPAMNVDLLVTIAATALLFFAVHTGFVHKRLLFWKQKENHVIERIDGVVMLLAYAAYIGFLAWRG